MVTLYFFIELVSSLFSLILIHVSFTTKKEDKDTLDLLHFHPLLQSFLHSLLHFLLTNQNMEEKLKSKRGGLVDAFKKVDTFITTVDFR